MSTTRKSSLLRLPEELQLMIYGKATRCYHPIPLGARCMLCFGVTHGDVERKTFVNLQLTCKSIRNLVFEDQTYFKVNHFYDHNFVELFDSLTSIPRISGLAIRNLTVEMSGIFFQAKPLQTEFEIDMIQDLPKLLNLSKLRLTLDISYPVDDALLNLGRPLAWLRQRKLEGQSILKDARVRQLLELKDLKTLSIKYDKDFASNALYLWYNKWPTNSEMKTLTLSIAKAEKELERWLKDRELN